MTPSFCCGFECGKLGPHWSAGAGTPTFDTTTVNAGTYSLRCNASGSPVYAIGFGWGESGTISVLRAYVIFPTALPTGNSYILWKVQNVNLGLYFQFSDSKLYCRFDTTNGASGFSVSTGQWYLIDIKFNQTGGSGTTVDAQINGSTLGQASGTGSGATSFTNLGIDGAVTCDIYFDSFLVSATSGDYPLGSGKVLGFVPASDGTHTATSTNIVKGTTGTPVGAAITSATSDSFNWVNARPIGGGASDNTRLINQQTLSSGQYVEHGIEQTSETSAPRAVEVVGIHRQAATQSCNSTFKVNDNGTENTVFAQSANGLTSDQYFTKHYGLMPADSAAWTLARFKALKLRFGYSSDATPDVYLRGWAVEAEFPVVAATSLPFPVKRPQLFKRRI